MHASIEWCTVHRIHDAMANSYEGSWPLADMNDHVSMYTQLRQKNYWCFHMHFLKLILYILVMNNTFTTYIIMLK